MHIININDSLNANSFDGEHRIQKSYDFISQLINEFAENAKKAKQSDDADKKYYEHNSIFVMGRRGSGKTTFLLSTAKLIKEKLKMKPSFWI